MQGAPFPLPRQPRVPPCLGLLGFYDPRASHCNEAGLYQKPKGGTCTQLASFAGPAPVRLLQGTGEGALVKSSSTLQSDFLGSDTYYQCDLG